jgi:hypothetical protein
VPTQAQIDQFARMNAAAESTRRAADLRLSMEQRLDEAIALSVACEELAENLGSDTGVRAR